MARGLQASSGGVTMPTTLTPPTTGPTPPPPTPPPPTPPPAPRHRLVRPRDDRMVAGVASGIARHVGLDPSFVRVAFVVLTLAGGSGVLAYLIAWLVIPEGTVDETAGDVTAGPDAGTLRLALGALLVLVGLVTALDLVLPAVGWLLWPIALIVLGVTIILTGARR